MLRVAFNCLLAVFVLTNVATAQEVQRSEVTLTRTPIHGVELGMPVADAIAALKERGFEEGRRGAQLNPFVLRLDVRPDQNRNEAIGYGTRQVFSKDLVVVELEWTGATAPGVRSHIFGETLRSFEDEGRVYLINRYEQLQAPSSVEAVFPALQERFGFEYTNCEVPGSSPHSTTLGVHVSEAGNSDGVLLINGMRCHQPINFRDVTGSAGKGYDFTSLAATSLIVDINRGSDGLITSTRIVLSAPKFLMTEVERFWAATVEAMDTQGVVGSGLSDY